MLLLRKLCLVRLVPMGLSANTIFSALDDLPAALTSLFEALSKKTRWKFSCVMAGPDPQRDDYHI